MLFIYVDDILSLSHKTKEAIGEITSYFTAKQGSIKKPDIYLGANVAKFQLPDGRVVWSTSPLTDIRNAVKTVEQLLTEDGEGYKLRSNTKNPLPLGYRPELDVTEELGDTLALRYLQLVGILRWKIELGLIDINLKVALMSQYQALPRLGHLKAVYHIFAYLKSYEKKGRLTYNPKSLQIDETVINSGADWKDFYGDVEEKDAPKNAKAKGEKGRHICICGCKPRWECYHVKVPHWYHYLSSQCLDHLVF